MHVGWALVFDGVAPSTERLVAQLRDRLDLMPHFRRRLSTPRVQALSWPEWVEDPDFDVANHVRRAGLPAPGGEAELLDWLGDFLAPARPGPPAVGVHRSTGWPTAAGRSRARSTTAWWTA